MLIKSSESYKSVTPINPAIELPDLVVLSGLNGTGKTQLLGGIVEGRIQLLDGGQPLAPIKFVDHSSLAPKAGEVSSVESSKQLKALQIFFGEFLNAKLKDRAVQWKGYIDDLIAREGKRRNVPPGKPDEEIRKKIVRPRQVVEEIAQAAEKQVDELQYDDILTFYPLLDAEAKPDIFAQDLTRLISVYHRKLVANRLKELQSQRDGAGKFLSEADFKKLNGEPPWDLVNRIIEEAQLEYIIHPPENVDPDAPFVPVLTNTHTGARVAFADLSSGEKVIMSLVFLLYNSKLRLEFPKLVLMDEPDAHLHPALTKQFFDVIQNVFIGEKGMKVILTTHSPSTVALAPEEALYIMNKSAPRIKKATKDQALRLLTRGVPTLSVSYENRRQVFVEGGIDVRFFEKVYDRLREQLLTDISLDFISFGPEGEGKGDCGQVKNLVNSLASKGNRTVHGIIDWDGKNEGNERVRVLGRNVRYAVENYILDPLILAAFLFREKIISREALDLEDKDTFVHFAHFGAEKLQTIAGLVVKRIQSRLEEPPAEEMQEVEYVCGKKIQVPIWFLTIQGHKLEEMIREEFPKLNKYKRNGGLKAEIIGTIIDDVPGLVPRDVLALLEELQGIPA